MAVAEGQTKSGEYPAAVHTYQGILKSDPLYAPALDGQLDATMLWVENFQVLGDDKQATNAAGSLLDEIMPILDAGLARSKGSRAADVQAHLGWAHWLNWHIAEREYSHAAEQNLRAAVELDKTNVYANAMLGNWMLQNNGDFQEAIGHLNTAVSTGKARPLAREMQVGGLLGDEHPGARAEMVKAVNDMRKNGEALDDEEKNRVRSFCYSIMSGHQGELVESSLQCRKTIPGRPSCGLTITTRTRWILWCAISSMPICWRPRANAQRHCRSFRRFNKIPKRTNSPSRAGLMMRSRGCLRGSFHGLVHLSLRSEDAGVPRLQRGCRATTDWPTDVRRRRSVRRS